VFRELGEIVVGPGERIGESDLERVVFCLVVDEGDGVRAERDAIELAVDLAAVELVLVEIAEIERLAEKLGEIGELAAPRPFEDVAVVHLDDVGEVLAGGLRGELRPVVGPGIALWRDRYVGMLLAVEVNRRDGALVAIRVTPPDEAGPALGFGESAARGDRRSGGTGRQQPAELAPRESVAHAILP